MKRALSTFAGVMIQSILLILFLTTMAHAQVADTPNPIPHVLEAFLRETLFPLVGSIVLALLGLLIKRISEKTKTTWALENQQLLENAALSAIAYAEEKAAHFTKTRGEVIQQGQKLAIAIKYLAGMMPAIDRERGRLAIEAMLGRIIGAGATNEEAISVTGATAVEVETKTVTNR